MANAAVVVEEVYVLKALHKASISPLQIKKTKPTQHQTQQTLTKPESREVTLIVKGNTGMKFTDALLLLHGPF